MYIFKALLGSILAFLGVLTALSGSILWVLYNEILSTGSEIAKMENQFFLQNFGPKIFIFLMVFGILKATIGIKTAVPSHKEKNNSLQTF